MKSVSEQQDKMVALELVNRIGWIVATPDCSVPCPLNTQYVHDDGTA